MGSAGYRIDQGEHIAHNSIVSGEIRFILRIKGHRIMWESDKKYNLEREESIEPQTCSKYLPLESIDVKDLGIDSKWNVKNLDDLLAWYKKDFESYGNVFEEFELYEVSAKNITETLKKKSNVEKVKRKRSGARGKCYCNKCS